MIEITVGDCGCSVSQHRASPLTVTMNYCPKHAAADEMYDAHDLVIQEVHNTGNISTDTIRIIAAALALADGDGGE